MTSSSFIPVNEPLLNGNELKYVSQCISSGWISSDGPFVSEFENKFAARVERKHGIAVSSGTGALDIAFTAVGISKGDEVILPTFTIISCVAQLVRIGAVPLVVDSYHDTWNMDVSLIEQKITPKTKAILIVHIYGLPVDYAKISSLAMKYNLRIIEDSAEAHGQVYFDQPCGSLGDISIFSFYANKHLTTGEGGMIVTDSDELMKRCRDLRNLCFRNDQRFVHYNLGWNMRMTNLQAAIGLAQLERLDEFIMIKKNMGKLYTHLLSSIGCLQLPVPSTEYASNHYWVYGVVIDPDRQLTAKDIMGSLLQHGIGTRPFFYPMHLQPVFRQLKVFEDESHPVAEYISKYGFYLPSGLAITEAQIETTCTSLREVLK